MSVALEIIRLNWGPLRFDVRLSAQGSRVHCRIWKPGLLGVFGATFSTFARRRFALQFAHRVVRINIDAGGGCVGGRVGVAFGPRHPELLSALGRVHLGDDLLEGEVTCRFAALLVLLRQNFFVQINPVFGRTEIIGQLSEKVILNNDNFG